MMGYRVTRECISSSIGEHCRKCLGLFLNWRRDVVVDRERLASPISDDADLSAVTRIGKEPFWIQTIRILNYFPLAVVLVTETNFQVPVSASLPAR
jgi:hypothetical protein